MYKIDRCWQLGFFQNFTFRQKIFGSKHENPKVPVKNHEPLFFKDFPAKNIPFENASPKNGKFIDWDFTLTVLGDANGVL